MRKLKQLLCRHKWKYIERNSIVNEVLEQCTKCGLYNVWHRGINLEYKTDKFPTNIGWEHIKLHPLENKLDLSNLDYIIQIIDNTFRNVDDVYHMTDTEAMDALRDWFKREV